MYLYIGGMPSASIEVWRLQAGTLANEHVQTVGGLFSPSFLCKHPELPVLYAVERRWSESEEAPGALTTFAIDASDGTLQKKARCAAGGSFTAHVNVTADGRFVTTANPRGPTATVFALGENGIPAEKPVSTVRHSGRGATERQRNPWPHSSFSDKSGQHLLVCDLALDRIMIYKMDSTTGRLTPGEQPFAQVSSGAGARHLALDLNDRFAYVVNELDSTVSVFHYEQGRLAIAQTVSTVPPDFDADNLPAEIALGRSGRFLYVTNRGHDSIAVYDVCERTGRLQVIDFIICAGRSPRHIAISPDGTIAAVSNQQSNEVALFRIGADGLLTSVERRIPVTRPTCVAFVG